MPRAPRRRPRALRLITVAVLVLVVAACSGGETFGIDGTDSTNAPPSAATTTAVTATSTGDGGSGGGAAPTTTTGIPGTTDAAPPSAPLQGLALEVVATGLHQPTVVVSPPGDPRLFVVERRGVIRIIDEGSGLRERPFLDIQDRVGSTGIEQGLLGLDFHPDFADNGRLFVYHVTLEGNRRLAEYRVGADPDRADPGSERVLFEYPQPAGSVDIRHYAGMVDFGPDGLLYVSLGDGADATNQGQNPDTVYGTVVRIDVDAGDPYAIPAGNPFPDGGAPEVWVYGLRNPWRFTIDPAERLMYIADVGQDAWEEINILSLDDAGTNFGWPDTQGHACYLKDDCDPADYTLPVFEYDHDTGCSVTGGVVYRGDAIPELDGQYFYADWCEMWVHSFRYNGRRVGDETDWSGDLADAGQVNAFGTDAAGEMYVANFDGAVAKIVPVR